MDPFSEIRACHQAGRVVPAHRPTYYPFLGRSSPVWTLFFLRRDEGETDAELIRALEQRRVDWALYTGESLAESERQFPALRPDVVGYLNREFEALASVDLPPRHLLLRRRHPFADAELPAGGKR